MTANTGTPTLRVDRNQIVVSFGRVPHLILSRGDIVGVQSWLYRIGVKDPLYVIEITTRKGATITAEYDDQKNWEAILIALAEAHLFDQLGGE